MVDLALLNHAVLNTWGEKLQVQAGSLTYSVRGVYVEAYKTSPVGNTEIERPDPSFLIEYSEFQATGASVNDLVIYNGVSYTIVGDPEIETGDWCSVPVSVYA